MFLYIGIIFNGYSIGMVDPGLLFCVSRGGWGSEEDSHGCSTFGLLFPKFTRALIVFVMSHFLIIFLSLLR